MQGLGQLVTLAVSHFVEFSKSHNKVYPSANVAKFREEVFNKNLKKVQGLNNNSNNSYPQGMTIYADLTDEEFSKMILNPRMATTPDTMLKFPGYTGAKEEAVANNNNVGSGSAANQDPSSVLKASSTTTATANTVTTGMSNSK